MAPTYQIGLQLDRTESGGAYSPENCQWSTKMANIWNRSFQQVGRSSKYTGVCYNKRQEQWTAGMRIDGKRIHLGTFTNEKQAALAYDTKCLELRGEYAQLNRTLFPDDFPDTAIIPLYSSVRSIEQQAA